MDLRIYMKIAYLLAEDLSKHPGLERKINGQIAVWKAAGHAVYKVMHYSGTIETPSGDLLRGNDHLSQPLSSRSKITQSVRLSRQYAFIARALESIRPDITYTRYLFPAWRLKKAFGHCGKLLIEINSDDLSEYQNKNRLTGYFNRLFRTPLLERADGFVFVTRELADSPSFAFASGVRTVIANGIDCHPVVFYESPGNTVPQLGFIGSPGQSWHGLDKLKALALILPDCFVHVIGPDATECLRLWGSIPENIKVHGYLGAGDASQIMSSMDVGIASLALHRKKMDEACPLKMRQYLAHGIPVLGAFADTDISPSQDFYCRLPNCEDNIVPHAEQIRRFVSGAFNNVALRSKARYFAENNLAQEAKEAVRLAFFASALNSDKR